MLNHTSLNSIPTNKDEYPDKRHQASCVTIVGLGGGLLNGRAHQHRE